MSRAFHCTTQRKVIKDLSLVSNGMYDRQILHTYVLPVPDRTVGANLVHIWVEFWQRAYSSCLLAPVALSTTKLFCKCFSACRTAYFLSWFPVLLLVAKASCFYSPHWEHLMHTARHDVEYSFWWTVSYQNPLCSSMRCAWTLDFVSTRTLYQFNQVIAFLLCQEVVPPAWTNSYWGHHYVNNENLIHWTKYYDSLVTYCWALGNENNWHVQYQARQTFLLHKMSEVVLHCTSEHLESQIMQHDCCAFVMPIYTSLARGGSRRAVNSHNLPSTKRLKIDRLPIMSQMRQ